VLVLQVTNAGVSRPGYKAAVSLLQGTCVLRVREHTRFRCVLLRIYNSHANAFYQSLLMMVAFEVLTESFSI